MRAVGFNRLIRPVGLWETIETHNRGLMANIETDVGLWGCRAVRL
jgi:hypothetical protein